MTSRCRACGTLMAPTATSCATCVAAQQVRITATHSGKTFQMAQQLADKVTSLQHSVEFLLRMIAVVPEQQLSGLGIDPYGTIGDALELLGKPRGPDSWRALSQFAHGYDCGPYAPPTDRERTANVNAADLRLIVEQLELRARGESYLGEETQAAVKRTKLSLVDPGRDESACPHSATGDCGNPRCHVCGGPEAHLADD